MAVAATKSSGTRVSRGAIYTIVVEDWDIEQALTRMEVALSGYGLRRFLWEDVSEFYAEDIESRFAEEGDVKSEFWPELSSATVRIREQMGYPGQGPINHRTGDLEAFLTDTRDIIAGDGWAQLDVPGASGNVDITQKLEHAQHGSDNNPLGYGPTPPRPVLATSEMDLEKILKMLMIHVLTSMSTSGAVDVA